MPETTQLFDLVQPITAPSLAAAAAGYLAFVGALFAGSIVLPGIWREGAPQPDGRRVTYKLSGLVLFLATHIVLAALTAGFGVSLMPIVTHFASLFVVANAFALFVVAYLFVRGRRLRSRDPSSFASVDRPAWMPTWLADIWFGVELNPALFGVDLKMFAYHPSLIGLALCNVAFAYTQYEIYQTITPEMWLYQLFTWSYLLTHYIREDFMLSTWDIIAERFGFMLVWGDLVYVPFLYSMVGWFVLHRGFDGSGAGAAHDSFPIAGLVALAAFHVAAHWIFRGSNWQKDRFKRDPHAPIWGRAPETIGGKILVSGFWGIGRKINYSGEIGVYLSFSLCAGFESAWPYFLPCTLLILLVQRAGRDDRRCRNKYGALWEEYCNRARFRMFPLVY